MAGEAERVLTQRELNRALLARQLLLERVDLSIPNVLERMAGLQAQYAPSMYIGLWSRMEGFQRDDLTRALERRRVVQGTLMRSTIHLVSAADYWPFALGIRRSRREWWFRVHRQRGDTDDIVAVAGRLRRRFAGGTLQRDEIHELLGKDAVLTNRIGLWLDLVRVPPSGTWERRRADLFATAEDWVGAERGTPEKGIDHLVRRYLGGFGPSTGAEIAGWAGIPPRELAPALDRLRLRRFRSEAGKELLDLPRASLPDPETPAPVRFLPTWDATLLVHARGTGILPGQYRPLVFNTRTPHSVPTFLVDGAVAGSWRYERGRIVTQLFGRVDRTTRRELGEEAERLADFHA